MKLAVVMNPAAGGGRMGRRWPDFAAALARRLDSAEMRETRAPGDAARLARDLALQGFDIVAAAGGDGTISEVADGLLNASAASGLPAPALAVMPAGTGNDFSRTFAIPRDAAACVDAALDRPPRRIDAGRVTFVTDAGERVARHFVSVASLGVSGEIDRVVNASGSKRGGRLSGKALFFVHTLRELLRYRFRDVEIRVDGHEPIVSRIVLVAVANNPSFGGGMIIAPDAVPDDGLLEVVIVRGMSRLSMMRDLRLVYTARHRNLASCSFLSGRRITVTPLGDLGAPARLDIDGESPGRVPATFEVLARALVLRGSMRPAPA